MKLLIRNVLILVALGVMLIGGILFLKPYIARLIFLFRNDPFTIVKNTLDDDASASVRGQAALTLVSIDRARAVTPLVQALQNDSDIREDVETALVNAGKPALPPLLSLAENYKNWAQDETQINLLESIVGIIDKINTDEGKNIWNALIRDRALPFRIRVSAVRRLGASDVDSIPTIVDYLDSAEMRIAAIEAIEESKNVDFVPFLIEKFFSDPDSDVRLSVLAAMSKLLGEENQSVSPDTSPTPEAPGDAKGSPTETPP